MTLLIERIFGRTLNEIVERHLQKQSTDEIEAWLFEDKAARRRAEAKLRRKRVSATFRSAYKPLLCFMREEADLDGVNEVLVRYPVHPAAHPDRFLQECYPLAMLFADIAFTFEPGTKELEYEVCLSKDGTWIRSHCVFAPNVVRNTVQGECLCVCGWERVKGTAGEHLETEFEQLFHAALHALQPLRQRQLGVILIKGAIAAVDEPLGWSDEVLSFKEALHEDLYFSIREQRGAATVAAGGQLHARPGQIVPDIRATRGDATLHIELSECGDARETRGRDAVLDTADRPLKISQVRKLVLELGHQQFAESSRWGRLSRGCYKPGTDAPVLISAAQHANETTGVVGALRAAGELAGRKRSHFALVPVENMDGYEVHQRLIRYNPRHINHAARYSASGDDISSNQPVDDERAVRIEALARSKAAFHINLHGYPAHEWTRPLSGYLPKGFENWTMPKGYFLIMHHHPGWRDKAMNLMRIIVSRLAAHEELVAFNAMHIAAASAHSHETHYQVMDGMPYSLVERTQEAPPMTFVTEAQDETVYGEQFRRQQEWQRQAVLAAYDAYQDMCRQSS
ncbi:MAG: peptidase M14 [Rhizobiaceae bacterium]